jgi:hypothetical protein
LRHRRTYNGYGRYVPAVVKEVVFGEPYTMKPEGVGEIRFLEHFLVEARLGLMELGKERR